MCMVSLFYEEYGFVVRCNMCSIICEVWSSTFVPCHDTFALQKASFIEESSDASWSKCVASHLPNHFSRSCIQSEHNILLLYIFCIFFLTSHAILGSRCEGLFWTLSMYSTTLSMTMISMGSDLVSRRVYGVCFVTCRNSVRKCFQTIYK